MIRTRILATGGAIVLAAGAVAIVGMPWMQPAPSAAARSAVPAATAEIVRGTLRDTKTVTGTLGYGELSALRPSLPADSAKVTWIAPVGSVVERGEPLFRLDGQPTILLYGAVPQHRTLRFDPGNAAPTWVELEQARAAMETAELTLRLDEARLADAQARAADASARLKDGLSGTPATAEFIQLAGAVSAAEAKVGRVRELTAAQLAPAVELIAAQAALATARAGFDAAIRDLRRDLSVAGLDAATARVGVAEAKERLGELRVALEALLGRPSDGGEVAQLVENLAALGYRGSLAEQVRAWQEASGLPVTGIVGPSQVVIADGPIHVAAHDASVGETLVASSPDRGSILDYSETKKLVVVPLAVGDRALAALGRPVKITLPDDTEVDGTISEIGSVVTDGTIKVSIDIADQAALGGLEVASVDVEFMSESRKDVLSVPIEALLARPEGGFAVEVVSGGSSKLMPVTTGLFASGRVEIRGEGIAEGMRVGVPG